MTRLQRAQIAKAINTLECSYILREQPPVDAPESPKDRDDRLDVARALADDARSRLRSLGVYGRVA